MGLLSKSTYVNKEIIERWIERWERCGKEEWREGTRGEAVHGVKQLLASACWRMVKTWLRAACHWCALIRIISAGSCVTRKTEDCAERDVEGIGIKMHVHTPYNFVFLCYSVR